MSISSQRFKFLDKETNVASTDFFSVNNSDTLNSAIDNMVLSANIEPISIGQEPLENAVRKAMDSVKSLFSGDIDVTEKIKESLSDIKEYIPPDMVDTVGKVTGEFKNAFNKISNLKATSLCDLINLALGISLASLLFNLSPDMMKRLLMLGILALLSKMCNAKLNDLGNPTNFINAQDIKDASKKVLTNVVKPNTLGSIRKYMPNGANPIMRVVNDLKKIPNPISKTMVAFSNPALSRFA